MIIWNVDLEKASDHMKAYSKYKTFFYGFGITKNILIGFIVRRIRDV